MKGSDNQEKLVYQIIEDAGNKGNALQWSASITTLPNQLQSFLQPAGVMTLIMEMHPERDFY